MSRPGMAGIRTERGFTLIEVMIGVAIVAILVKIGLPSYTEYVRRSQVSEAQTLLADYRIKLEQYFQDYRNYGTADGDRCANAPGAPAWSNGAGIVFTNSGAKYFTLTCVVQNTRAGYLMTATGATGAAVGHVYTVDQDSLKKTTQFKGVALSPAKECWLQRSDTCE
jgi:type IV pilus assembly protein PilE